MKGKYDTLFLIGNGFDRWQGLPTSYNEFKKYYNDNVESLARKLGIKPETGGSQIITPVEKVFGDIFRPEFQLYRYD